MFLGRGYSFPIALEGALKLKELAYVHAEGYPAGEMKHGPLALIEDGMPVVVIAPRDQHYKKTISNMQADLPISPLAMGEEVDTSPRLISAS